MQSKKSISQQPAADGQKTAEEERQKLVVQVIKLPNGATFTRLRPVGRV